MRSPTALIQASENGAWPPSWRHGWKWSDTTTLSKPCCSAQHAELDELARAELLGGGLVADLRRDAPEE